jgi:N-acyl-L-homoserine lactone synthetase
MGHKCDSHVDDKVDDAYDSYNTTYLQSRIQEGAIGNQKILGCWPVLPTDSALLQIINRIR